MVNTKNIIIVLMVLTAGVAAYILLSDSKETRIRKRFRALGETFQKDAPEAPLLAASKAGKVKDFFAEISHIDAPAYSVSRDVARKEIPGYILQARSRYASLFVDFTDYAMVFPSDSLVDVSVTVTVTGELRSGERTRDIQEMSCRLQEVEDDWIFQEVEMVEVLEK